jgi:hypothetical protein
MSAMLRSCRIWNSHWQVLRLCKYMTFCSCFDSRYVNGGRQRNGSPRFKKLFQHMATWMSLL